MLLIRTALLGRTRVLRLCVDIRKEFHPSGTVTAHCLQYCDLDNCVVSITVIRVCGPGSVVGITTGYGLDGPGIESRWRRNFPHLSRPTLEPTQSPVQWVPGLT